MNDSAHLDGKVVIVTGGSSGIGRAVAAACLARGARVMIGARDVGRLQEAVRTLGGGSIGEVDGATVDVRDHDQVQAFVAKTVDRFGGLDILVNNAGVGGFAPIADQSLEQWHSIIETNLSGVFYCCRAAIPHLRRRGGGFIVNISSLAGKNAFTAGGAYCASKAALNMFSEVLMQEVRYDDIRVSYVMPGSVTTAFDDGSASAGADWKMTADDVAEVVLDIVSVNRRTLASRVEMRPSKPNKK